jgi:hypothetical protein
MLSKKSFGGIYENFLKLLMRSMRGDVWDHIASQKNDHGLSYRHYEASQRRSSPKITIARFLAWFDFRLFRQHRSSTDLAIRKSHFRSIPETGHRRISRRRPKSATMRLTVAAPTIDGPATPSFI